jgi:hypothetical protein
VDFGKNGHVLHAGIGKAGFKNAEHLNVSSGAMCKNGIVIHVGGLIQPNRQGLPYSIVINSGTAVFQKSGYSPEGFMPLQRHNQIGLSLPDQRRVNIASDTDLGYNDTAALRKAVRIHPFYRKTGMVGCPKQYFAQKADSLPADACQIDIEWFHETSFIFSDCTFQSVYFFRYP